MNFRRIAEQIISEARYRRMRFLNRPIRSTVIAGLYAGALVMLWLAWKWLAPDSERAIRILGYAAIPTVMAWAGLHLAADIVKSKWNKLLFRALFLFLAALSILIVAISEKNIDHQKHDEEEKHKKEISGLNEKLDKLLDIQTHIAAPSPYPTGDIRLLQQQLKDQQERTSIALDLINKRLSQIGEVHKDDLRTRALQASRDLLALLYQHHCDVDVDLARRNPDFMGQLFVQCITRMREEYYKTYQKPVLQILDELQTRGLDVTEARSFAQSGWNTVVVQHLAFDLSQLAERLPKD